MPASLQIEAEMNELRQSRLGQLQGEIERQEALGLSPIGIAFRLSCRRNAKTSKTSFAGSDHPVTDLIRPCAPLPIRGAPQGVRLLGFPGLQRPGGADQPALRR